MHTIIVLDFCIDFFNLTEFQMDSQLQIIFARLYPDNQVDVNPLQKSSSHLHSLNFKILSYPSNHGVYTARAECTRYALGDDKCTY